MLESELEAKIVNHCKRRGILAYKFNSMNRRGVPDRLLIANGSVLFLEVKKPGEEPTPLQYRELDTLNNAGVVAKWADNLQTAVEIIDDHFAAETI